MLGEIGVRLIQPEAVYMEDAVLGWTLRPGWYGWRTQENRVWVAINKQGLFDHDHSIDKPAGTRRIALVGDSFLSAFNVPLSQSFGIQLEEALNRCSSGQRVETINFGVGGYGTAQELLAYRAKVRQYRPDAVVLLAYLGNDIVNNHRRLNPQGRAPHFKFAGDELVFVPMPGQEPQEVLDGIEPAYAGLPWYQRARLEITGRSKAARLTYDLWAAFRNGGRVTLAEGEPRPDAVLRAPLDDDLVDAWRVTEALLRMVATEVEMDGAEFLLVTVPTPEQADGRRDVRRALAARYGVESLDYADRRVNEFAAANGVASLSLLAPLTEYAERNAENLYGGYTAEVPAGTGHWNQAGNRVAASAVAQRLCSQPPND